MGNKFTRRRIVVDDRYTRPQGLYQHGDVDHKKLRKLILDAKLAPCYPGADDAATDLDECPICFLFYPSLNRSKCCTKGICTECFLQMKSPQTPRATQCPFCKSPSYAVEYRGAKSLEEKGVEEAEEQKVIEAKIRMRQKELQDEEQRMLRREEDVREGRMPTPSDVLRRNFSNLHGFTIPSSDAEGGTEADNALLRDSIPEGGLTHGQNGGRLLEGQPQVDHIAIPVVMVGSDSGSTDSQQQNLAPSANLLASQRSLARHHMGIGSSGGASMNGQAVRVLGASRFNREDEFDLDLEDIMVMEAIWLSIQEQGPREQESVSSVPGNLATSDSARTETDQNFNSGNNEAHPSLLPPAGEPRDVPAGRSSVTGGLAGAIAALAERQVLSVDSATTRQTHQNSGIGSEAGDGSSNMASNGIPLANAAQSRFAEVDERAEVLPSIATAASSNMQVNSVEDLEEENKLTESEPEEERGHPTLIEPQENHVLDSQISEERHDSWIELSLESGRAISPYVHEDNRSSMVDWIQDHSSEAVEFVTSFSSSVPSASELPWEAPDFATVQSMEGTVESQGFAPPPPMVPESFEEQMMLAMALSLAEAQAQSRPRRL